MVASRTIGACLVLALACASLSAQTPSGFGAVKGSAIRRPAGSRSVSEWIEAALAKDTGLAAKRLEVEKARAALSAIEHPSLVTPSISTGTSMVSLGKGSVPAVLTSAPKVQATLAEPWGTSASLAVGIETPLDGSGSSELQPAFELSQPLNELLFPKVSLALLEARSALADAESALASAEAATRVTTLELLQAWAAASHQASSARVAQDLADRDFANAKTLGTYAPSSAAYLILSNAAATAAIAVRRADKTLERARSALVSATGLDDTAPPLPPSGDLVQLEGLKAQAARSVAQAERRLVIQERSWNDAWVSKLPALASELSASKSKAAGETEAHLSGRIGASAAWDQVELASGFGWNGSLEVPYVDFSLTWKPDRASDRVAERTQASIALDASRLALAEALESTALDIEDVTAARADRVYEALLLDQALELAALKVQELEAQVAAGIAARADLNEAVDDWQQAAADVEKAAWNRVIADARLQADYMMEEVAP